MDKIDLKEKLSMFSDHWSPKIVAEMNDGVLKVTLPKKESAQSRRIAISVN